MTISRVTEAGVQPDEDDDEEVLLQWVRRDRQCHNAGLDLHQRF